MRNRALADAFVGAGIVPPSRHPDVVEENIRKRVVTKAIKWVASKTVAELANAESNRQYPQYLQREVVEAVIASFLTAVKSLADIRNSHVATIIMRQYPTPTALQLLALLSESYVSWFELNMKGTRQTEVGEA